MGKRYAIINGEDVDAQTWQDYCDEQLSLNFISSFPTEEDVKYLMSSLSPMSSTGWKWQPDEQMFYTWVNVAEWELLRRSLVNRKLSYSIAVPDIEDTTNDFGTTQFTNKGQVYLRYRDVFHNFRGTATAHKIGIL